MTIVVQESNGSFLINGQIISQTFFNKYCLKLLKKSVGGYMSLDRNGIRRRLPFVANEQFRNFLFIFSKKGFSKKILFEPTKVNCLFTNKCFLPKTKIQTKSQKGS